MDAFCPTFTSLLYSSLFPLNWPPLTPFQPVWLTSVLAESIQENVALRLHPTPHVIPDCRCPCLVLLQIQRLPGNRLCCHLAYASCHSTLANLGCPKRFEVHFPHHFLPGDDWFFWFGGHLRFKFVLQGVSLQTKPVAKVIFLTV